MTDAAVRDANTGLARAFVDELARVGLTEACVAPGSRSTPLALALAADPRVRVHVHLDERSAGFFALGIGRATGHPALVLTTSGTATANLHPAVLEAHHGRVPLLVCTADRPPELRDTGAGQTIDQSRLYGDAVRWYFDPGPPEDRPDAGARWRTLACRAIAHAGGPPAGPVHLNLPFREPLVPTGAELVPAPGRDDGRPWTRVTTPSSRAPEAATVAGLVAAVRVNPRGALVAGWGTDVDPAIVERFADIAGWPVLADPLSNVRRGETAVSTYDALVRVRPFAAAYLPTMTLRLGAPLTGKAAARWLDDVPVQWVVDADGTWLDPAHTVTELAVCDAESLLSAVASALEAEPSEDDARRAWRDGWRVAERSARRAIDDLVDGWAEPFEGRVARDVVRALPSGAIFLSASSMPVRDVESFSAPRDGIRFLANRGVNGIDGFVSTVIGAAAVADAPVVALLGDLCFLHDANGLLGAGARDLDATFVVVDNDGGGIFSFLPQADDPTSFEQLFGTPHGMDLAAVAAVHGVPTTEIEKASDLVPALEHSIAAGGVRVVLVRTDRTENVARHREVFAAVERALEREIVL